MRKTERVIDHSPVNLVFLLRVAVAKYPAIQSMHTLQVPVCPKNFPCSNFLKPFCYRIIVMKLHRIIVLRSMIVRGREIFLYKVGRKVKLCCVEVGCLSVCVLTLCMLLTHSSGTVTHRELRFFVYYSDISRKGVIHN